MSGSSVRLVSAAGRILSLCREAQDSRVLRREVLAVLRRTVGFDAYAWLLTDPVTTVGSSPLADVPCGPELPESIRLKYLSPTNRWTSLASGRAASLAASAVGEDDDERHWRAFLARYGIDDIASIVFRDGTGCWGFLDLWRSGRHFDETELRRLEAVLRPLAGGLRQCQRAAFETSSASASAGPAVLLLSPKLKVSHQTEASDAFLRALLPTEVDRGPVPATAYNVGAQLLAVEAGVDDHLPVTRVALESGQWLTFRAARLRPAPDGSDSDIAVTIENTTSRDRIEMYCHVHGLSQREREVLTCLADGDDTRTISGRLYIAEFTVQDHLKSVFDKTGVRSRRLLIARAAG